MYRNCSQSSGSQHAWYIGANQKRLKEATAENIVKICQKDTVTQFQWFGANEFPFSKASKDTSRKVAKRMRRQRKKEQNNSRPNQHIYTQSERTSKQTGKHVYGLRACTYTISMCVVLCVLYISTEQLHKKADHRGNNARTRKIACQITILHRFF